MCLSCGTFFCRTCLAETNDPGCCPKCHREKIAGFASKMGSKPVKEKAPSRKPLRTGKKRGVVQEEPVEAAGFELPDELPSPELPDHIGQEFFAETTIPAAPQQATQPPQAELPVPPAPGFESAPVPPLPSQVPFMPAPPVPPQVPFAPPPPPGVSIQEPAAPTAWESPAAPPAPEQPQVAPFEQQEERPPGQAPVFQQPFAAPTGSQEFPAVNEVAPPAPAAPAPSYPTAPQAPPAPEPEPFAPSSIGPFVPAGPGQPSRGPLLPPPGQLPGLPVEAPVSAPVPPEPTFDAPIHEAEAAEGGRKGRKKKKKTQQAEPAVVDQAGSYDEFWGEIEGPRKKRRKRRETVLPPIVPDIHEAEIIGQVSAGRIPSTPPTGPTTTPVMPPASFPVPTPPAAPQEVFQPLQPTQPVQQPSTPTAPHAPMAPPVAPWSETAPVETRQPEAPPAARQLPDQPAPAPVGTTPPDFSYRAPVAPPVGVPPVGVPPTSVPTAGVPPVGVPPAVQAPSPARQPAVAPPDPFMLQGDQPVRDEHSPLAEKRSRAAKRPRPERQKGEVRRYISVQYPDEYDGELTDTPLYARTLLVGLLAAVLLAAAYAGFEYWQYSGRMILGYIIGFVIGITVVYASGRHFSPTLGLAAAVLSWFSLCLGKVSFSVLDVRYNNLIPLKQGIVTEVSDAITTLLREFKSFDFVLLFILTGVVAFVLSFRPWPLTIKHAD